MLQLCEWKAPVGRNSVEKAGTLFTHQVEILAEDSCGRRIMDAAFPVTVQVSGPGVLKGLENGNLGDNTPYTSCSRSMLEGRLIAYIQRTGSGTVTVKVSSEGLPEAQLSLEIPD